MKIVAISDTHGALPVLEPADVVVIAGDVFPLAIQRDMESCAVWFEREFIPYLNELPCKHVVFVGGNHDFYLERKKPTIPAKFNSKIHYLYNNSIELELDGTTYKFWGTPATPELRNWAFYRTPEQLEKIWKSVSQDVDVIISHCPPRIGRVDTVLEAGRNCGRQFGCTEMIPALEKLDHPVHLFCGHIHSGSHVPEEHGMVKVFNCSLKNESYNITYSPQIIDIQK